MTPPPFCGERAGSESSGLASLAGGTGAVAVEPGVGVPSVAGGGAGGAAGEGAALDEAAVTFGESGVAPHVRTASARTTPGASANRIARNGQRLRTQTPMLPSRGRSRLARAEAAPLDTRGLRSYERPVLRPGGGFRIESLTGRPLSIALVEPFTIASGRMETTRAVEVEVTVVSNGTRATGLGEAACLPPVTAEDQPDVLRTIESVASSLVGVDLPAWGLDLEEALGRLLPQAPVARAGIEMSLLDATARIAGLPLRTALGGDLGGRTCTLETDVTIAIADPARMADLALSWHARGFRVLKIKVGAELASDIRALEAIARAIPGARLRIDANAGFSARQALALAEVCESLGLRVECWEQPCAAGDLDAMAEVAAALEAPVIADESVKTYADLVAIAERRCADGINLKIAKMGGLLRAYRIGVEAKARGLKLMAGGMVETRLGMTAGAHLVCALGGVDFVDLDTAWLLESEPYEGGYRADGPDYTLDETPGLGVRRRE